MKTQTHRNLFAIAVASAFTLSSASLHAANFTWDGGGGDGNTSTAQNWSTDLAPAATGDSLTFAGASNLTVLNDSITSLGSTSFTFAAGAGSFNIGGNALTVGNPGGNDNFVTKISTNDQTISANINFAGGGRDRTVVMTGGATLTLSGNINFANDWMFPTTAAGTIVLSGNNSGDGKGGVLNAGTNSSRAMMRNNVANTQLILGSDTALGNSGSGDIGAGTANFRGLVANQNMSIGTQGGARNLAGSSIIINTANVTFNGADNLAIGNIINQGGNRDFWVTNSGSVTVQNSLSLSNDQTGRTLYTNLTGAGGMVVNGKVYDTFHSGGITSGQSTLRKAGTGTLTLNGDSSYTGLTTIENGTLKIGHANALGATGASSGTTLSGSGILDLNGISTGESITINSSSNKIINSSASAAGLSADASLNANLTVDATGDITASRLIGNAIRTVTKIGNGTLTTNGSSHNNLTNWDIQAGKVVFANTSGLGADRGVTLNGGTLQLSGANSNLINDSEAFTINSGIFDLNDKAEAVASIGGNGGTVTNSSGGSAHLYLGGGSGGSSSANYGGVIEDGNGTMQVTKEGTGTQTLAGANTYSGATTIANGTLALAASGSIDNTSGVSLGNSGTFDVSAKSGGYTVDNLIGSGTVLGSLTVSTELAIGNSPGTVNFDSLTLAALSVYTYELTGGGITADLANIAGALTIDTAAILDLVQLGTFTVGDKFTLFAYETGNLTGTFAGLSDGATFTDANGDEWQINYFDTTAGLNGGTGTSFVTVTAVVPEPAAALLGSIGMLVLLRRRRI